MRHLFTLLLSLCLPALAQAETHTSAVDLGEHFRALGLRGTFVLYEPASERLQVYQAERAATRYTPASTFKVFNTLAGLDSAAVRDVDEVLPYGGKPQWMKVWERDMGLREAMRLSNVPIYQEVARRVGATRMQAYLQNVGYGNAQMGKVIDRFWLDGPLAISAIEQTQFLARLAQRQLPFSQAAMQATEEIMQIDRSPEYTLYAKTGWAANSQPGVGWWVGWVARQGKLYSFALNVDLRAQGDVDKRIPLGRRCLQALGVL